MNATFGNAAESIIVGLAIYAASNDPEIVLRYDCHTSITNRFNTWKYATGSRFGNALWRLEAQLRMTFKGCYSNEWDSVITRCGCIHHT